MGPVQPGPGGHPARGGPGAGVDQGAAGGVEVVAVRACAPVDDDVVGPGDGAGRVGFEDDAANGVVVGRGEVDEGAVGGLDVAEGLPGGVVGAACTVVDGDTQFDCRAFSRAAGVAAGVVVEVVPGGGHDGVSVRRGDRCAGRHGCGGNRRVPRVNPAEPGPQARRAFGRLNPGAKRFEDSARWGRKGHSACGLAPVGVEAGRVPAITLRSLLTGGG